MADKKYLDYEGLKEVATEVRKVDTVANNAMCSASCANTRLNNLNGTQVSYNNATSGMTANNVQGAVDELYSDIRQISHGIVPRGTVEFENLPSLASAEVGDMYNISDDFTTTEDFITPGINEKAGSNVYVAELENNEKKWDVFAVAPDVVVDQSYNPLSHNPQSGTAVAQIADTKVDVSELPLVTQVNTSIGSGYSSDHSHTIYNAKLYVAGSGLYVSENGLDFTNVPVNVSGSITVVGAFNGKIFTGSSEGEVGVSSDGINFEAVDYFGEYDDTRGFVEFNGKLFVLQYGRVSSTSDGENFSNVQGLNGSDYTAGLVFNNKLYIAGRDENYTNIVFWVSSDGLNFTKVEIDPSYLGEDYNVYCHGMTVFNDKLYVVLEYSEDETYKVFSSSDGVTFSEESGFPADKRISTLTVIDDVFYVGTEMQGVYTSIDAVSFTLNTDFPTNTFIMFITKYNGVFEVQGSSNEGLYQISTRGSLHALKPSFVQSTTVPTQNSDTFMSSGSIYNALSCKVDKVSGKGLSTCDFTSALRTKLNNIECGAEVNVQSDWNQSDDTKDDYIKNKPNLASVATSGDYDDLTDKPVINGVEVEGEGDGSKYELADLDKLPYGSSDSTVLDFTESYYRYFSFAKKIHNKVFFSFTCDMSTNYPFSCVSSDGGTTYEYVYYIPNGGARTSQMQILDIAYCEEVASGNNYWNAIIKGVNSSSTELCTSSDGITFTPVSSGNRYYSGCVAYHGMLLYGDKSGSGLAIKYSQSDYRTRLSGEHVDVLTVIDDTIYVITGSKKIYTSTDADNFTQVATVSFTANNMVKLGSTYYFQTATVAPVTNIPKLTTSGIYMTTDFTTFTNLYEVDEGILGLATVFDDKLFVTIGHGLYSTTDCVTFTPCDLGDEFFYPKSGYYSDFCAITAIASIDDTLWVGNYRLGDVTGSTKVIKLKNLNNSLKYLRPSMVQSTSAATKGSDSFISSDTVYNALSCKVDKVAGKGLSTNDFSSDYKYKLDNIQCGAEVNVQPDWNQSDSTQDDFVKNKPSINGKILISDGTGRSYSLVDREELPSNITLDTTQFTSWSFQYVIIFKNKLCAVYNSNHIAVFSNGEWTYPTIPSGINSFFCPTVFGEYLCFATEDGLYVTEDLVTFTLVEGATTSISKLTVFNNKLYLTGYNTPIYVTEDLTTFTTLDFTASGINDMTSTSTKLYVAVRSDFVYVSTDGATFTHLTKPETLPTNNVGLMKADEDASIMYIGTLSNGLYISNLDLTTAQATEIGAPYAVQCVAKYKGQVFVGTENGIYVQDDDVFKLFDSSDTVSLQEYDDELYAATYEDGLKSFKTEYELQYLKPSDVQSTSVPTQGSDTFISSNGVYVALSSLSGSVDTKLAAKVDKVEGKGLSTNDFTTEYKDKLDGIESGAEVNVQSDWNAVSGDAYIDNKPQINSVALTGNNNGKHYGLVDEADLPEGSTTSRESIQLNNVPNLVRGKVFDDKLYLVNTLESFINYTEDGTSWETSTVGETVSLMTSIEVIDSTLCVGAEQGLFTSSDGQNFTLVEGSPTRIQALYVIPGSTPMLLIGAADGVYVTDDLLTLTKISSLTNVFCMTSDSLYVYYGTTADFIYYAPINQIGLLTKWNTSEVSEFATESVYTISSVENGVIRFGMDGLYTGSVIDDYITKVGLDDCFVISTLEMNNNLFVGADTGLFIQSGGSFTRLDDSDAFYSLTEFEGKLYATTMRHGVYVYVSTAPSHNLRYLKPSDVEHTTVPTENSDTFISSGDVKTAIDSALSSVYKAKGSKTVEEMLPALLIESNLGYVYNMSNSGTTTQYFVEGAGHTIKIGDNVVIIKDTDDVIKFDLLSGLVDLSNYVQKSNTTGLLKNDGSVDTNAYTTCTGTVTSVSINSQVGTVSGAGIACVQCVCAYLCRMTLSDTQVALVGSASGGPINGSGYYALFSDSTNALKYNPQCQKLTVGSRFCVCDSSVSGRSDFSFSGSQVAFYTPTCSGNGICMDMNCGKITAKCFDGNATCFAGCTFACACTTIRSGLTSCTGTVTVSNSTCTSSIPVALCTGSTAVGRSTCCALKYQPSTGLLSVDTLSIRKDYICTDGTGNFTLSTAGVGNLKLIPNYGVCLTPIIPTSTPSCLCNGMIWIS
ncbi:MAG: hypothetical protein J6Y78_09375 [Paludibacteraceae bacterium]|nr:hypothetical protein [Paludibacteraceae bacterium]